MGPYPERLSEDPTTTGDDGVQDPFGDTRVLDFTREKKGFDYEISKSRNFCERPYLYLLFVGLLLFASDK